MTGVVQRRVAVDVVGVEVGLVADEQARHLCVVVLHGAVQGRVLALVERVQLGVAADQHLHDA